MIAFAGPGPGMSRPRGSSSPVRRETSNSGQPGQGGVEFNLLLIASMLVLILAGPGVASLDAKRASTVVP